MTIESPRYGNGGSHGKRIVEFDEVAKGLIPTSLTNQLKPMTSGPTAMGGTSRPGTRRGLAATGQSKPQTPLKPQSPPKPVAKAQRHYDPEANRQRRLGVASGAAAIGGAALLRTGYKGIKQSTKLARRGHLFAPRAGMRPGYLAEPEAGKAAQRFFAVPEDRIKHAEALRRGGVTASRRDLAHTGAGLGLLGAAGGIQAKARHDRNRAWR